VPVSLPDNKCINKIMLFRGSFSQIDPRGLYTFMPHEIGEKGDIVTLVQKTFRKSMAEGVRIDNRGIDMISDSQFL